MKYLSKIIKKFKKTYKGHVWKRPNHKPTDSYFYLAIQLDRCMMRDDALNLDIDPVITGSMSKLRASSIILHLARCIAK